VTPDTETLDAAELDAALASVIYPHGAHLSCEKCRRRINASRAECVSRMGNWWTCCGIQMQSEARVPLPAKGERVDGTRGID